MFMRPPYNWNSYTIKWYPALKLCLFRLASELCDILTLFKLSIMGKHKNIFIISEHWDDEGCWNSSFWMDAENLSILHSQYHGYWWPSYTRIQGISSHDFDLVMLEISSFSTKRVKPFLFIYSMLSKTEGLIFSSLYFVEPRNHFEMGGCRFLMSNYK